MSKTSVRVVARIVALPDQVEAVKAILTAFIEPTRQEKGCITYELLQNDAELTDFTFVEEWDSNELLDKHLQSKHIQEGIAKLSGLLPASVDIRRYHLLA